MATTADRERGNFTLGTIRAGRDSSPDTLSESFRRSIGKSRTRGGHNPRVRSRARKVTLVVTALLVSLTACASGDTATTPSAPTSTTAALPGSTSSAFPLVITSADVPMPDAASVAVASDSPGRIVSLATGVAESLVALGLADRIVGRDETSTAPQLESVPVLTKAHAVSAERVLATDPDLVLVDAATSPPEALGQIRAAGVEVIAVPEAWNAQDVLPRTRAIASAVGLDETAAEAAAADWTTSAESRAASPQPRVAFLYLRGTSAIYLIGGAGSGADALIEAAGGVDVGSAAGLPEFTPLTAEALAQEDPDVLLVMTGGLESVGGVEGLTGLPGVAQTRAGREGRVVAVEDTLLLSYGPRTGALVDALAQAIATAAA